MTLFCATRDRGIKEKQNTKSLEKDLVAAGNLRQDREQ